MYDFMAPMLLDKGISYVGLDFDNVKTAGLDGMMAQIRSAIADPALPLDRVKYHLAHDAYHLGQVMQTRGMQGLDPIL